MKKIICVLMTLILLWALFSCDEQKEHNDNITTNNKNNNIAVGDTGDSSNKEIQGDSSNNETVPNETQDDKKYIKIAAFETENDIFLNIGQSASVDINFTPIDVDDYNGEISFSSQGIATATYETAIVPFNGRPYGKIEITGVREGETTLTVTYPGGTSCSKKVVVIDLDKQISFNLPQLPIQLVRTHTNFLPAIQEVIETKTYSSINDIQIEKSFNSDNSVHVKVSINYHVTKATMNEFDPEEGYETSTGTAGFRIDIEQNNKTLVEKQIVEKNTSVGTPETYSFSFNMSEADMKNGDITLTFTGVLYLD